MAEATNSNVAYIYSNESANIFDKLPSNLGRSSLVHGLIEALGLFRHLKIYRPKLGDHRKLLETYHSSAYLNLIFEENLMSFDELDAFGLVDDCSIFDELAQYATYLGGSVYSILKALDDGYRYVINWDGGRHHAHASMSSGYCYVNDVVVLNLNLQENYDRILYIDLDVHHGDGVENAFLYSDKVFTFSIHKFAPGFFPGTGSFDSQGRGKGLGYCLNIPVPHKISGDGFYAIFTKAFSKIISEFDPDIIVCVCGADILTDDPHSAFNVGSNSYSRCVKTILDTKIPTVFLGGGGYNHTSTAKCWSILSHTIISSDKAIQNLPELIPEHEFWPRYSLSDYLEVVESNILDPNESDIILEIIDRIENMKGS